MRELGLAATLLIAMVVGVLAQEAEIGARHEMNIDHEHTQWIDQVMRSIATVKPGMTRRDLLRVFTEEGGISARSQQRFVYRHCPYIKVDVEFSPLDDAQDRNPDDKIAKISRPFLEYSISN
jgi:hypothetical protein